MRDLDVMLLCCGCHSVCEGLGWSSQDTWSDTSPSPRSIREALAALLDLDGLSSKDPFDEVTAWQDSWYWADDTFLLYPSSSPSASNLTLVFSPGSSAVKKFTGDPSLTGDSEDEDLFIGDLEWVEHLVSSKSLYLLTGAWDSLVLYMDGDMSMNLLSTGGLSGFSGPDVSLSMRLCIMVIMNMKSRRLAWFIPCLLSWSLQPCWSHNCWNVLSCQVGHPCCVVTSCWVSNHCRVYRPCRTVIPGWASNLCRARRTCRVVRCWTRWRLDDSNGPSLWLIRNGSCQVYFFPGHMSRPQMVCRVFLITSGMMLSGQEPVVDSSPGWLWGQGPVVNYSPQMMTIRRPGICSLRQGTCWSRMVHRISTMPGPGAGPSRWRRWSGLLPTLMAPGWVMSSWLGPGWLMTSGWSPMMISMTMLITVQTMAIWPPSPGWAVGPGGSIHHRHTRWHSLAGLLVGSLGQGGWLFFHPFFWRVGPEVRPGVLAIQWSCPWIHEPSLGTPPPCASASVWEPCFREPISTHVTRRFSGTQCHSVVATTLLTTMMVVTATPKVRVTRELELWFLRRRTVMWFRHLVYLSDSKRLLTKVGIKDVLSQNRCGTRQIWGIWKLRPAYNPETLNLGQNWWCFVPCDLEIWWMTLENNRAPLLCCFKLCATFHNHRWIQTGVAVRKRPIWVKFDDF